MKYSLTCLVVLFLTVGFNIETATVEKEEQTVLPFTKIELNDLEPFNSPSKNWKLVGDVNADRSKEKTMNFKKGTGVLLNSPKKDKKGHLFTTFEHGDIELELDVMMPIGSNSGLYFQGRYEVQLLDSWGVDEPQHSDIGGIYQRWDKNREHKGYEGIAPRLNAAKAPGLWQHFKIVFQAPRFDASGTKIKNAIFKEVWLNGALLHLDQEVKGTTRSSAFNDEKSMGPLMIQGDHGPVAFKNIKYKLYDNKKVAFENVEMLEFENSEETIPNYKELTPMRKIKTDTVSAYMTTGERVERLLVYKGQMTVPNTGEYLVEMSVNSGGGLLLFDDEEVINLDGTFTYEQPKYQKVSLKKGSIPFTLVYNKHRDNRRGFKLEIEGPGIKKQYLQYTPERYLEPKIEELNSNYDVDVTNETVLQRGFVMHKDKKRTHVITVGTANKANYAYDLSSGSLLQAWGGDFINTAHMWDRRGNAQLAVPIGALLELSGDPEIVVLENGNSNWPDVSTTNDQYKQLGYELDGEGIPTFLMEFEGASISNKLIPTEEGRGLKRIIKVSTQKQLWHKIGEGKNIEKLSNNTYIIDDKNYFVEFSDSKQVEPEIRSSNGTKELLVNIPAGKKEINYTIIW